MIYCNNIDARYNGIYRNTFNDLQYIDDGTHYNKDFWAFAYKEDERALNLMCKPVKGRIKEDNYLLIHMKKLQKDLTNWLEPELVL